jgi:NhaP-type Na+/H+ or K+/H+ antiporter
VLGSLILLGLSTLAWALSASPLARIHLRIPVLMTIAGILVGLFTHGRLAEVLESDLTTNVAEIALAILLFVDATEVRSGRLLGKDAWMAGRLLAIALPLSLAAALGLGLLLLPYLSWAAVLVLACAVVPIDFASSEGLLRDRRLPHQVRELLNVEGGYNDGIVSPVFAYALLLAGSLGASHDEGHLGSAVEAALLALLTGLVLGTVVGWLLTRAERHAWATSRSSGIAVLVLPVLVYGVAVSVSGNGFVAAFVSGVTFRQVRLLAGGDAEHPRVGDHDLLDDVTTVMSIAMWFVFGNVVVLVLTSGYLDIAVIAYSIAVLTVVRALPVLASLLWSSTPLHDRMSMALLGPRGTTSIVFGLLAFNQLADPGVAYTILGVTALAVFGSVLLHGLGVPMLLEFRARRRTKM